MLSALSPSAAPPGPPSATGAGTFLSLRALLRAGPPGPPFAIGADAFLSDAPPGPPTICDVGAFLGTRTVMRDTSDNFTHFTLIQLR